MLFRSKRTVLNSLGSPDSTRAYAFAIDDFITWYCSEPRLAFGKHVVLRYRIELESRHLAPATINLRLAAVRRLAFEAADSGLLSPELGAGVQRVKGAKKLGVRLGNWLTADQCRSLLRAPDEQTVKGGAIGPFWHCYWDAVCVGLRLPSSRFVTSSSARNTGR